MASRLNLHEELCTILGSRNVYYDPPESVKMKYPCIRYSLSGVDKHNASDKRYRSTNRYEVVVIETDADSAIPDKILSHFPMCSFDTGYTAGNLHHKVYTLYY